MKQIHKTLFTAGLLFGILMLTLAAWATPVFAKPAFAKPAVAKSGNKVTGHYIREITPEIAWEMSFSAHEAVTNKKGKTRPAKGYAMGYRISPDIPGEPLFWVMAVTCTKVFDENYARFAGVVTNHANPDRIGKPIAFEAFDYAQPGNGIDHLWPKTGDFPATDCPDFPDECTTFEYAEAFCDGYSDPPPVNPWYVTEGNIRVHFVD